MTQHTYTWENNVIGEGVSVPPPRVKVSSFSSIPFFLLLLFFFFFFLLLIYFSSSRGRGSGTRVEGRGSLRGQGSRVSGSRVRGFYRVEGRGFQGRLGVEGSRVVEGSRGRGSPRGRERFPSVKVLKKSMASSLAGSNQGMLLRSSTKLFWNGVPDRIIRLLVRIQQRPSK